MLTAFAGLQPSSFPNRLRRRGKKAIASDASVAPLDLAPPPDHRVRREVYEEEQRWREAERESQERLAAEDRAFRDAAEEVQRRNAVLTEKRRDAERRRRNEEAREYEVRGNRPKLFRGQSMSDRSVTAVRPGYVLLRPLVRRAPRLPGRHWAARASRGDEHRAARGEPARGRAGAEAPGACRAASPMQPAIKELEGGGNGV